MQYRSPRGTHDILPEDFNHWHYVTSRAEAHARAYGFQRIETPIFEQTTLFTRSAGEATDVVEKEMYTFLDRDGESMTLRPEATAAVCRAYLQHGMRSRPQPVKLYSIAPFFRYDRPQADRYRQFHQFNVEAIGEQDPSLDAEIVQMAWSFYQQLGLRDLTLLLNSIGCPLCRPEYLERLKAYYMPHREDICEDCRRRLDVNPLRLLDCKNAQCQPFIQQAPKMVDHLGPECSTHFEGLIEYLSATGVPYQIEHRLVRGFDYYTKTVFEIVPPRVGAQSTIGGGGRYDGLIEQLGGPATPAVGFATGIERIISNLRSQEVPVPKAFSLDAYIVALGEGTAPHAFRLAAELRAQGISTMLGYGRRSAKSQFRQADALGARYALILGEDEVKAGTVKVKQLETGEERQVAAADVAGVL